MRSDRFRVYVIQYKSDYAGLKSLLNEGFEIVTVNSSRDLIVYTLEKK